MTASTDPTPDLGPIEMAGPAAELARLMAESSVDRYSGILLCPIGEDQDWLIAPGHVPLDVLTAAVTEYANVEGWMDGWLPAGDDPQAEVTERTRHLLAKILTRCSADCECEDCTTRLGEGDWAVDWSGRPDATVPLTVVEWQ